MVVARHLTNLATLRTIFDSIPASRLSNVKNAPKLLAKKEI